MYKVINFIVFSVNLFLTVLFSTGNFGAMSYAVNSFARWRHAFVDCPYMNIQCEKMILFPTFYNVVIKY